ncbi:MAG: hypothetical protein Q27BPR15_02760 [Rhodobacter sp. CACIA14H1]|nr:MAG: hypothetical protein Q27BPR15_02760 [Rhodobacter sp. CACIA14H1]
MTFHADVPQHADLVARLAPIRAHFLASLAPRRERLATFLAAHDALPPPALMRQLQEDAHKIRGVALTLGFDALGRAAGVADDLLDPWQKAADPLELPEPLPAALAALLAEIDAATA